LDLKKLLILDLDETLIHTSYSPISGIEFKAHRHLFYLYERPYLSEFLERYKSDYSLAIWSASKLDYVRWIIKSTVLCDYEFTFINSRRNCKRINSMNGSVEYQKDISPYIEKYDKVLVLDDFPKMVTPIKNAIKISEFRGSTTDIELLNISLE